MRRDVAVELEHDLRVIRERDVARIAAPAATRDEREQRLRALEADETEAPQRPAPDAEDVAEPQLRAAPDLDHSRRRTRACVIAAATSDADPAWDDHDAAVREQLEVAAVACAAPRAAERAERPAVTDERRRTV